MFDNLTDRLGKSFRKITGKARLTDNNIKETLKEVRKALLDADVAWEVVKPFIQEVKDQAVGQEVTKSLTPSQAFIKIVNNELTKLMGQENASLSLKAKPPAVILMAGLQGSGKTTTAAKLAKRLQEKEQKSVMMVSCDIYRPAAIDQLQTVATEVGAEFFPSDAQQKPVDIAKKALSAASKNLKDILIVDTAGRLHIDDQMMDEIKLIHKAVSPVETLFVVDSMTGQDAAKTARAFDEALPLTGVILTKTDGDARGGAALSMKYVADVPIKFLGVGEKIENFEVFYPDRIANRLLGMGDIVSLVEKAAEDLDQENLEKTEEKIKKGQFSLEDYLSQLRQMKKMGGIEGIMSFLPGVSKVKSQMDQTGVDEKIITQNEAIILSMTKKERENPKIIDGSRKKRIANGSGTDIANINKLLKQFKMMSEMMKKMSKGNIKGMADKGIPPELFNQLK